MLARPCVWDPGRRGSASKETDVAGGHVVVVASARRPGAGRMAAVGCSEPSARSRLLRPQPDALRVLTRSLRERRLPGGGTVPDWRARNRVRLAYRVPPRMHARTRWLRTDRLELRVPAPRVAQTARLIGPPNPSGDIPERWPAAARPLSEAHRGTRRIATTWPRLSL